MLTISLASKMKYRQKETQSKFSSDSYGTRWRLVKWRSLTPPAVVCFECNFAHRLSNRSRPKRLGRVIFPRLTILVKYLAKVMLQPTQPFENCKPSFPERLFVICSLWLSLILNGVFTSQLAASFSRLHYYDDIDTLEQLEESGLVILTSSRDIIEDALTDTTSPVLKRLRDRMMYANETEINRRLFRSKDAAYLHQLTTLPFKYNEHQRRKLHIMKECPKDYILANIIQKGYSPFVLNILFNVLLYTVI
ncbi:uncharacterized protein LOC143210952 [Lasioglossum baleicum]|uniref:uncharacterized protein LOC143210952 n=1 Tax=Lasioglossum baleicum TaxID=434251 RepID=UPI003FCCF083